MTRPSRPTALLLAGIVTGVAAAAAGLVSAPSPSGLPASAIARVNDTLIRREDYERVLAAAQNDRREPLDAAQRRHVLDRLVDDELLVQRGLELGLADSDRKVRADLSMAVIASITEEQADAQPDEATLRRFYDENQDFFANPCRLRLRQVFVRVGPGGDDQAARERAVQAAERLRRGDDFQTLQRELGDDELAPVPNTLLPPAKLRDYIGPTALQRVLSLADGETSDPVRSSMGYHVLQVIERQADQAPEFGAVRTQVLAEYRRRAGEEALRQYLRELRQRAEVVIVEEPQ